MLLLGRFREKGEPQLAVWARNGRASQAGPRMTGLLRPFFGVNQNNGRMIVIIVIKWLIVADRGS